jgi:hypothetical protein
MHVKAKSRLIAGYAFPRPAEALVALLAFAVSCFWASDFFHDDSYIPLRYASRVLEGHGLTWNDHERAEGFSSPLWVLELIVLGFARLDLVAATRFLGVAHGAACLALLARSGVRLPWLLVAATLPSFVRWSVGGLETAAAAFFLLAAQLCLLRADSETEVEKRSRLQWIAGGLFATGVVVRPEFPIVVAALTVAVLPRLRFSGALRAALPAFLAWAAYVAFRFSYFGEVTALPTLAKTRGIPLEWRLEGGLEALAASFWDWGPLLIGGLIMMVLGSAKRPMWWAAAAGAFLFVQTFGGGDHMPGVRLLVPALVLLILHVGVSFPQVRYARIVPWGLFAIHVCILGVSDWRPTPTPALGASVGRFFEKTLPAGTTVAAATAGSVPYYAPSISFIDTLGLNDRVVARREVDRLRTQWQGVSGHRKGDGAYVLSRKPDVIVLGPVKGFFGVPPDAWFLGDIELLELPGFAQDYRPIRISVAPEPDKIGPPGVSARAVGLGAFPVDLYVRRDSPALARLESLPERRPISAGELPPTMRAVGEWVQTQ